MSWCPTPDCKYMFEYKKGDPINFSSQSAEKLIVWIAEWNSIKDFLVSNIKKRKLMNRLWSLLEEAGLSNVINVSSGFKRMRDATI